MLNEYESIFTFHSEYGYLTDSLYYITFIIKDKTCQSQEIKRNNVVS